MHIDLIDVSVLTGTAFAGAASWTVLEYGLHRFAMHELRGKGMASKEHLKHHADVTYFASTLKKGMSAVTTAAVVWPAMWFLAGPVVATAFTAGLNAMYMVYELAHRRIHTHPPRSAYGRWMRRSHLQHHSRGPMRNFGVTANLCDRMLGTYDEPSLISVPRRHAPTWLLDDRGDVKPEFAADYVVKARARSVVSDAERQRDRVDAFANRVPSMEDLDAGGDASPITSSVGGGASRSISLNSSRVSTRSIGRSVTL
jgi:hypothetical protein